MLTAKRRRWQIVGGALGLALAALVGLTGCGTSKTNNPSKDTSKMIFLEPVESDAKVAGLTTEEYKIQHADKLPPVKGIAAYDKLHDNTVKFAINVWAGWGPIILANEGMKPGKVWKTPGGKDFKVELVLIDNPVTMRDTYAGGKVHIGWGTLDMVPLFMEGFVNADGTPKDSKVMPRIFQQIDWSNGGDGIVVRERIKTVADLKGKKLALAQNSPSQYFALNMLVYGGVQPADVNMVFTDDAFQAAAAFNAQKDIDGCVSWSPDIYKLEKGKGNHMLVTTHEANRLIADIWFARADFAKENPDLIDGIVRGIFDAMEEAKTDKGKQHMIELMATAYNIPKDDAKDMLGDAHNTNWRENFNFFLDPSNPTNFQAIWNRSYYLYSKIGSITHQQVPFDQVMDFSVIERLGSVDRYKSQKDEYQQSFTPKTTTDVRKGEQEILTNTVYIRFYPNSWDLHKKIDKQEGGKTVEELYDPNVDRALDEIGKLIGQFSAAQVIIEGHTDASMKGQVPESLVKDLSQHRAQAVADAVMEKSKVDPNRLHVEGMGWSKPLDPGMTADAHAKNRRVEVKIFTAEKP
jgi:NitT/TauT family transport system substrate-binding protein